MCTPSFSSLNPLTFTRLWALLLHKPHKHISTILRQQMDSMKINLVKLATDGSNWVMYRDRLKITLWMCCWQDHLTSTSVTKAYTDHGDINGIKPDMQWEDDDEAVKHLIMNTIPDDIFNRIKDGTDAMTWWDELKKICEGRS